MAIPLSSFMQSLYSRRTVLVSAKTCLVGLEFLHFWWDSLKASSASGLGTEKGMELSLVVPVGVGVSSDPSEDSICGDCSWLVRVLWHRALGSDDLFGTSWAKALTVLVVGWSLAAFAFYLLPSLIKAFGRLSLIYEFNWLIVDSNVSNVIQSSYKPLLTERAYMLLKLLASFFKNFFFFIR